MPSHNRDTVENSSTFVDKSETAMQRDMLSAVGAVRFHAYMYRAGGVLLQVLPRLPSLTHRVFPSREVRLSLTAVVAHDHYLSLAYLEVMASHLHSDPTLPAQQPLPLSSSTTLLPLSTTSNPSSSSCEPIPRHLHIKEHNAWAAKRWSGIANDTQG